MVEFGTDIGLIAEVIETKLPLMNCAQSCQSDLLASNSAD